MCRSSVKAAGLAGAAALALPAAAAAAPQDVIRTGGPSAPSDPKVAIVASSDSLAGRGFTVVSGKGRRVLSGKLRKAPGSPAPWSHAAAADLSKVTAAGTYRIKAAGLTSPKWVVAADARSRQVRRLLRVFAVNSDGNEPNPVFGPSHLNDAIVKGGPLDGQRIDLTGGWRDAGDFLKFAQTTAYAVAYMHLAARLDPADAPQLFAASDVGVRWLLKANPTPGVFIELVGDERDHSTGFRDPAKDDANTQEGVGVRFAYPTVSSHVTGIVAAALAMAAARSKGADRDRLLQAAQNWYAQAKATNALIKQTGPNLGDFYPDDDFTDDLAFAAVELFRATGDPAFASEAGDFLKRGKDDQYYSGITAGTVGPIAAAELCGGLGAPALPDEGARRAGCDGTRKTVGAARERLRATAFGSPGIFTFGWVQDNGATGALAAAAKRAGVASDGKRIAAAASDYMLGRNPWGASFVVGRGRGEARHPHHSAYLKGNPAKLLSGAVVGGATTESSIREQGFKLAKSRFRQFNSKNAVYEDRREDYVTSEVGLTYSASALLLAASLGN